MRLIRGLFVYWCTLLAWFLTFTGSAVFVILLIPITLSLTAISLYQLLLKSHPRIPRLITYYNFILATAVVAVGWLSANSWAQAVSAVLFTPLALYFLPAVLPRRGRAITLPKLKPELVAKPLPPGRIDADRRMFLKLIGSAGASVFFFSIFTKRAEAAFFGSVPGPGTVALKDSTGAQINPAEKHPTDGYNITEIDDASAPAYYGFVNKTGAWFIQREGSSGDYRYSAGSSAFSTNWTNRASLSYDYFDNVF